MAGGLASTVRDWVLDLANSLPPSASRAQKGRSVAAEAPLNIISVDWSAQESRRGWSLVRGTRTDHPGGTTELPSGEQSEKWILIGQSNPQRSYAAGRSASLIMEEPKPTDRIAIQYPAWDVQVNNEKWGVASRWEILEAS